MAMTLGQSKEYHALAVRLWEKAQANLPEAARITWGDASLSDRLAYQAMAKMKLGLAPFPA